MKRAAWQHLHRVRSRTREVLRMQSGLVRVCEIQRCRCGNARLATIVGGELVHTEWDAPSALPLLSPLTADPETEGERASAPGPLRSSSSRRESP